MRIPRFLLAAALLLSGVSGRSLASSVVSTEGAVRAGQEIHVEWSSLPADVEELEVLLSLDGSLERTVRLSGELDPALGSVRLRVPNLPAENARIILRVGIDGVESELPSETAFSIVAVPAVPLPRIAYRRGEWWSETGVAPDEPPAPGLESPSESITGLEDSDVRCLPRVRYALAAPGKTTDAAFRAVLVDVPPLAAGGVLYRVEAPLRT